ncbi:MAG: glycogen phosphorylase, partial [Methylophaga sp.]
MTPRYTSTATPTAALYEAPTLDMNIDALAEDIKRYYGIHLAQDKGCASGHYLYSALALTLRDRLFERMKQTKHTYAESHCKQAYYLSMEFLMGRAMGNAALNLGIEDDLKKALVDLGLNFEEL